MNNNKLPQEIFNAPADSLAKLAALFPSAVKDGQLDIAALREELGEFEEVGAERYELTWAGKQAAKKLSQSDVPGRTLRYIAEDSKLADATQNLYIEGDNLEVLKLLRQNYYGVVKMVYIDPPYNTGNDFVYRDDFAISKAESDEDEGDTVDGVPMIVNQKSSNRYHANWLNMMYPRLRIAKDLLRDDGVIFISINDSEIQNFRKICDEIFGEMNFVAQFTRKGSGGRQDSKHYAIVHEYVLCYAKSIDVFVSGKEIKVDDNYPFFDKVNQLKYKLQLLRKWGENSKRSDRPNLFYPISDPDNNDHYPMLPDGEESCWRWGKEKMLAEMSNGKVEFKKKDGKWIAYERIYEATDDNPNTKLYTTIIDDIGNSSGAALLKELFANKIFDYPKPVDLIYHIIKLANADKEAIILDFFSGSATTAHAVMQLNAEDNGNRKFILVQFPEACDEKSEAAKAGYKNICEIGKERIRRAGDKIKAEIEKENAQLKLEEEPKQVPDIGFKVFRTADTNIRWVDMALKLGQMNLDESNLSDKDKLDFMPWYSDIDVVYEVLLRQRDIPLSASVDKLDIGERTWLFADSYVVCLDEVITTDMVEELAAIEPMPFKYVMRDSAFGDDISLKDETIRRLEAYIARNTGEAKRAYTVEFI